MNKKRVIIIIVLVVVVLFGGVTIVKHFKKSGDVSNVELLLDDSTMFSRKDIMSAIDVIYENFKSNYPATMEKLTYDEKKCSFMINRYKKEYASDDVIVFYTDFTTYGGKAPVTNGFNAKQRYSDWVWILTRNKGEEWVLREWGY